MTFERKKLFDGIRLLLKRRGLTLTQKRVDAIEFLIKEFEKTDWRIEWIAYAMATIAHETAWTFKPIKEYRARSGRAKELQDRYWGSGFMGRGFVQLTWRKNYELAKKRLGVDLTTFPDLALDPYTAFDILKFGMEEGWFTGKRLIDYINDQIKDYYNARRIINGTDKADEIKQIAEEFEHILKSSITQPASSGISQLEPSVSHNDPPLQTTNDARPQVEEAKNASEAIIDAPPPTRFLDKLKALVISLFTGIGGIAGVKEFLGVQVSMETAEILKYLLPCVIGFGFLGLLTWYVSEKIVGWKTLKMQTEAALKDKNIRINPK